MIISSFLFCCFFLIFINKFYRWFYVNIGSHVSFNSKEQLLGSVREAISYGSNTFMFYTGASPEYF